MQIWRVYEPPVVCMARVSNLPKWLVSVGVRVSCCPRINSREKDDCMLKMHKRNRNRGWNANTHACTLYIQSPIRSATTNGIDTKIYTILCNDRISNNIQLRIVGQCGAFALFWRGFSNLHWPRLQGLSFLNQPYFWRIQSLGDFKTLFAWYITLFPFHNNKKTIYW